MKFKRLTVILLVLFSSGGFSQAIRFNTYNFCDDFRKKSTKIGNTTNVYLDEGSDIYFGIGYEQNVNDRISVSGEINTSLGRVYAASELETSVSVTDPITGDVSTQYYRYEFYVSYLELKYISKYFFRSNDERSGYFASTLGFKNINFGYADEYSGAEDIEQKESKLIFPLGVRLGWRGSIDGWFGDGFIGAGINIGAGKEPKDAVVKAFNEGSSISKVYFTAGYCFGIGWAD